MKRFPTVHCNERPIGTTIDTVVVHSMYAERCKDIYDVEQCFFSLENHQVSCHFFIDRMGQVFESVPVEKRAWHAGSSKMPFSDDQREGVNDFSLGIELLCQPADSFTLDQYRALANLIDELSKVYPIKNIVGHDQVAPGRKTDPGDRFDWARLLSEPNSKRFRTVLF